MATFFRKPDRRQRFLLPVDMLDWLPESDFVHLDDPVCAPTYAVILYSIFGNQKT